MKCVISFMLLYTLSTSCKQRVISGTELQDKLIETMSQYLHKTKPGAEFTVKDVAYYPNEEKKLYLCEFQVVMRYGTKDTTGTMAATISNDFNTVIRTR